MTHPAEAVLTTLPASDPDERALLVHCHRAGQGSWVELRQQSWAGSGLGWFTQATIRLEPQQLAALRGTLATCQGAPQQRRPVASDGFAPRIFRDAADEVLVRDEMVQADSA